MATVTSPNARSASSVAMRPASERHARWQSPWTLGALGSLLFWAALPPLNAWPFGWLAAAPFVLLARQRRMPGKRPYLSLYFIGVLFWLASVYWLTLPHWATSFGWLAISIYLGCYWPIFVGLLRVAIHRCRISPVIAAPIIWTGLEYARAYVLTGFLMGALAHTQYRWLEMIQISDLAGAYLVTFLLVTVGTSFAALLPWDGQRGARWAILTLLLAPLAAWGYGRARLQESATITPALPAPTVALIQGSVNTELKHDPNKRDEIYREYFGLSRNAYDAAVREGAVREATSHEAGAGAQKDAGEDAAGERKTPIDLYVWPETMFRDTYFVFSDDFVPPADLPWKVEDAKDFSRDALLWSSRLLGAPSLLGIDTLTHSNERREHFNSALFVSAAGEPLARYDKCYRVMFGEYVPLADRFPSLYQLTPLSGGIEAGRGAVSQLVGGVRYAPNICYETTSPDLIRDQVLELRQRGEEPDVLVNLTNDGWFWGSSELDMHLACGVFRAVECRKPMLVAANTGFSAWIEDDGQIRSQGGRMRSEFLLAHPTIRRRPSWYLDHGDWPASLCLVWCCLLAVWGAADWRRARRLAKTPQIAQSG